MKKARKSVLFSEYINFKRAQAIVRREVRKQKEITGENFVIELGKKLKLMKFGI